MPAGVLWKTKRKSAIKLIGDGDGNGRVITRISEGNQLRRANPNPMCLTTVICWVLYACAATAHPETARVESNHAL